MKQYLDLMQEVLEEGNYVEDRTGVNTLELFGKQKEYDLQEGFPLVTTKKMFWNGVVDELFWFLSGSTNVNDLPERTQQIWDKWANEDGELGPVYGKQWREWNQALIEDEQRVLKSEDQILGVQESIKNNPNSRRHIVSAWNVLEIDDMALPPCHLLFQFNVRKDKYLDCHLYQRSADICLGVPFNIASYSLLTHMFANVTDYEPGKFIHSIGSAHVYRNHIDNAIKQLEREPYPKPKLTIEGDHNDIDDIEKGDIKLENYRHHSALDFEIAV